MNQETVHRLSQYKSVLQKLKSLGFVRVFSDNLGDALGISSSLVRKDFSSFGLTGNKRGGYRVDELIEKLEAIFGKNDAKKVVLVGCGKIGTALINYNGFIREGIRILAGFDIDESVINPEGSFPIYDMNQLESFVKKNKVQLAVMTVPENVASRVLERLVACGIEGVLNFTPLQLKSTESCVIQNINLALELEKLFYMVVLKSRAGKPESATI